MRPQAYRELAKEWHPRRIGESGAARMIQLNVAYERCGPSTGGGGGEHVGRGRDRHRGTHGPRAPALGCPRRCAARWGASCSTRWSPTSRWRSSRPPRRGRARDAARGDRPAPAGLPTTPSAPRALLPFATPSAPSRPRLAARAARGAAVQPLTAAIAGRHGPRRAPSRRDRRHGGRVAGGARLARPSGAWPRGRASYTRRRWTPREAVSSRLEAKWDAIWEEQGTYRFDDQAGEDVYAIDTPPPTVSAPCTSARPSATSRRMPSRGSADARSGALLSDGLDDNGLPTERGCRTTSRPLRAGGSLRPAAGRTGARRRAASGLTSRTSSSLPPAHRRG